jgi:hypothetical protein
MAYLTWEKEATLSLEYTRLLLVTHYGSKVYTLELLTAPAGSFPYRSYNADDSWIVRYFLQCEDDPSISYNLTRFVDAEQELLRHIPEAAQWAEDLLLSPMDRLVAGLKG